MKNQYRIFGIAAFFLIGSWIFGFPGFATPAFGAEVQYSGQVVKVDPAAHTVIVKNPQSGGRLKFIVTDKTAISSGGEKKSLGDLKAGDAVEVEYTLDGGKYIANKFMLSPSPGK
jgi:hypothetical protein